MSTRCFIATVRPAWSLFLTALVLLLGFAGAALAQSGATVTPDQRTYLVSKDIGDQRWTIGVDLAATDPAVVLNVTGNVFLPGGGPASFVSCQVRPDSPGSLARPESLFRLRCSGASACAGTPRQCAQSGWTILNDDLQIDAAFFLPRTESTARERPERLDGAAQRATLDQPAQEQARGVTLTFDGQTFLVSKDVGAERWAIAGTFSPPVEAGGAIRVGLARVTGNVFTPGGAPPQFVYCEPTADSTGRLDDPASVFRLDCSGSDACSGDVAGCASAGWTRLGVVEVAASFFLPPGGPLEVPESDPELFAIGDTSGPPSIVTREFTADTATVAGTGACAVGSPCTVARVGACGSLTGAIADVAGFGCGCRLDQVPDDCIRCGESACGEACEYPVGTATARGFCLPFASGSSECVCAAIGAGGRGAAASCGGTLGVSCSEGGCCADDPLDGCEAERGDVRCTGLCVRDECPGGGGGCGICGTPTGSCGDGRADGDEECDRRDLRGQTCRGLGFGGGELACSEDCRLLRSDCRECLGPGEACSSDQDCCGRNCRSSRCAEPPPTPAPATPRPTRTPTRTAPPTATAPQSFPCQPQAGGPCAGEGFSGCCSLQLECRLGSGSPARSICQQASIPCGNGALDPGEGCDDGNTVGGDGCSSDCEIEARCGDGSVNLPGEECDDGNTADGDGCSSVCRREARCGDGSVNAPGEECDDGNTADGDGCSSGCRREARCGDGSVNAPGEECDDGNTADGDGCSSGCKREARCGDGSVTPPGEECDDGNTAYGDGCGWNCAIESAYCGNGIVQTNYISTPSGTIVMNEECDDGNTEDGDGCSSDCRQEPRCGDGSVDESIGEVCDDGNTVDGDGCNRFCQSDETCGNGYVDRPVGEECEFEFQCIVINPRYTCFGCICLPPLG